MKNHLVLFAMLLISTLLYSQNNVDSLVSIGINYHDNGQYDKAIKSYQAALEIDPNSLLVYYELAMSYMYAQEYLKSIECADKIIDQDGQYGLQGYITKASCLDYLGQTKESTKLYKKGIKKFGDNYLLYYNIGVNYYKLNDYDEAELAFSKAIKANPKHASSHLLLGYLMAEKKLKVQSILCLHYFLFLEPNSERSKDAYLLLKEQFGGNVQQDQNNPENINIFMDPNQSGTEFGAASLMLSMLGASRYLEENVSKSEEELFIKNTDSFFKILGELKNKKSKGLWWDFYVPFFYKIAKSDYLPSYCYYISQSSSPEAQTWLSKNPGVLDNFEKWLKDNN